MAALNGVPEQPIPSWITPLSEDRFWISFEIGDQTYERLQRAIALLRHAVPDGNVGDVFDRALDSLLRNLERSKFGATDAPRGDRRRVWKRDGGRCAFVGTHGRCTETAFLEFHHIKPFARGGTSTIDNIELRCRAHNQREAELFFGMGMPGMVRERVDSYGELGPDLVRARPSLQKLPGSCSSFNPGTWAVSSPTSIADGSTNASRSWAMDPSHGRPSGV